MQSNDPMLAVVAATARTVSFERFKYDAHAATALMQGFSFLLSSRPIAQIFIQDIATTYSDPTKLKDMYDTLVANGTIIAAA